MPRLEFKAGTWNQKVEPRPRRYTAYWLAFSGLLSYLSYTAQSHLPRDSIAHIGVGPPIAVLYHWDHQLTDDDMETCY